MMGRLAGNEPVPSVADIGSITPRLGKGRVRAGSALGQSVSVSSCDAAAVGGLNPDPAGPRL